MYTIRPLGDDEFDAVYDLVQADFPPIEYPARHRMRRHIQRGYIRGHLLSPKISLAQHRGYALMLTHPQCSANMLFLYATARALRARGLGSAFLSQLLTHYAPMDGMYAEVEKAEYAGTPDARILCQRRIAFYERLGFVRLSDIHHVIYGVNMHLYYKPIATPHLPSPAQIVQQVRTLYSGILRPDELFQLRIRAL